MTQRPPAASDPPIEPLTRREREVLALLAQGLSGPEIAEQLTVTLSSVKFHTQNIYSKLGANSRRQALDRARELGLLGGAAAAILPAAPATAAPALSPEEPAPGEPPYKGLRQFDEADAAWFFGREALAARLRARLTSADGRRLTRFLAVVGASGSGKSSLVRAGLLPALRPAAQPTPFAAIFLLTPTARPLETLAVALTHASERAASTATLIDHLAGDERALHLFARRLLAAQAAPPTGRLLLIVDQFEELFTLCRGEAERQAFIDNLLHATDSEIDGPLSVVITLRADFYPHCATYAGLREALANQQEYIGPMSAGELRQAVERPAALGGWEFEPGLVDQILRDVSGAPGQLPLLSHALLATWQNRRGRTLTLRSYAEAGRVQGAIATTAETIYQSLPPDEQAIARNIFVRLTELGEGTQDTRRRVPLTELSPDGNGEAASAVPAVLRILSEARLITLDEGVAEVAHEALIREWPTLRGWLNEDREGLRLHRRLTEAAQAWQAMDRDTSELYRGPRLAQALDWAEFAPHQLELNAAEREFLEASRAQSERETREHEARQQRELEAAQALAAAEGQRAGAEVRRAAEQAQAAGRLRARNRVISAVGVLALLAAVFAGFFAAQANRNAQAAQAANTQSAQNLAAAQAASTQAINSQREAKVALANQLAGQANTLSQNNIALALLLALEADRTADTNQARDSLDKALRSNLHLLGYLVGHTSFVTSVAFSPDGKLLASASDLPDSTIRLWNVKTHQPAGPPFSLAPAAVTSLAFSPDGNTLAVGATDHAAHLWDMTAGRWRGQLAGHTEAVTTVAFSPDGKLLATGGRDHRIILWDMATGQALPLPFVGHGATVTGVAFGPDGKVLASSSADGTLRLWEVATGLPRGEPLTASQWVINTLAFSPDGRTLALAAGGPEQNVLLVDVSAAQLSISTTLSGHTSSVNGVAFSADGSLLASASSDNTLRLGSVAARPWESVALKGHSGPVLSVAFSPDGAHLASGGADGAVVLWQVSTDLMQLIVQGPVARACQIAGRNLTASEWAQYLGGQPYHQTCVQWPAAPGAGPTETRRSGLQAPTGLGLSPDGAVYMSACQSADVPGALYRLDPSGLLEDIGSVLTSVPGRAPGLALGCSYSMAVDKLRDLYVSDGSNTRIYRIDNSGHASIVAGTGAPGFSGDGGPATAAQLDFPDGVAVDAENNLYIADNANNRVRKVDRNGVITTVAGNGDQGFSGDGGPANAAALQANVGLAFDAQGNLYVSDSANARVRKIDKQGIITTFAGNGTPGFSGDGGAATAAEINWPLGLVFDAAGNLYIAEDGSDQTGAGCRVRKVDTRGIISTVAGTGLQTYAGEGGPALSASFCPLNLAFDAQQNLYITDLIHNRLLRIDSHGIITTVAGDR